MIAARLIACLSCFIGAMGLSQVTGYEVAIYTDSNCTTQLDGMFPVAIPHCIGAYDILISIYANSSVAISLTPEDFITCQLGDAAQLYPLYNTTHCYSLNATRSVSLVPMHIINPATTTTVTSSAWELLPQLIYLAATPLIASMLTLGWA
ncbi:hypothetical protein HDU83_001608 [Entophlyctis luteolus]|nr:hypothetical protein HDU83_001608 [Entophlyctis luteolus]